MLTNTRISVKRCFELYIKTTLVNIALPLKLGELYRIYALAKTIGDIKTSVLCVLSERFFDILAIIMLIVVQSFLNRANISTVGCVFFIAILLIWIVYRAIPQTILFLKYYLLTKRHKKGSYAKRVGK